MPLVDKVRMLEEETDRFEDPRDLASRVNQVHLLTNLAFQLDKPTGDKTTLGEQKRLVEKSCQYQFLNSPG